MASNKCLSSSPRFLSAFAKTPNCYFPPSGQQMPLISHLAAFLAYVYPSRACNPTHQHDDTVLFRYHFLMPDFSEKENEMQRAGKGSNGSSARPVGRIVRGGVWSED